MNLDDLLEAFVLWSSLGICFALMAAEVLRLRQRMRGAHTHIASGGLNDAQHRKPLAAGPGGQLPANREQLSQ